jgi:hypothetical protein
MELNKLPHHSSADDIQHRRSHCSLIQGTEWNPNSGQNDADVSSNSISKAQLQPQPIPAIPSRFGTAWLKGEELLRNDQGKRALLHKYNEILGLELDINLKFLESTERHDQVAELLWKKLQELESRKIAILLGCTPGFEKSPKRRFSKFSRRKPFHRSGWKRQSTRLYCLCRYSGDIDCRLSFRTL